MPQYLKQKKHRAFTYINYSCTIDTDVLPFFFLLVFPSFLCFIDFLYLLSNETAISLRLSYYVTSRVQSQSLLEPSHILLMHMMK